MYLTSWSGGKDSCLACYKAIQSGYQISHLVNFISAEYKRVSFHGTPAELIGLQSEAIGIPLVQKEVHPDDYELSFKEAVRSIQNSVTQGMIFGDIYLQEHKQWVERICKELGIKAIEPLWGIRTEDILDEFIKNGFEAIIVSGKAAPMPSDTERPVSEHRGATQFGAYGIDKEWIGHKVDEDFIKYLKTKPYIDLCGESGEYHTFVINGPIFKKRIEIKKKEVIERDTPYGKWYFLDIGTTN
ncbi:MAG: diphthine--ammonia ligase [Planctomycetota bacterium]